MTSMGEKVLLVDDDVKLQRLLKEYLEGYGFHVMTLGDGSSVLPTLRAESPEIVVLDIMLPKKNGLEVLKEIRSESTVPVLMLTAKGEDADRIVGLELGADDYLPKPFNPRELLARLHAILRRMEFDGRRGTLSGDLQLKVGGVVLNKARQTVRVEDREVELSTTEFKILAALMERPNTVLTRDQIMNLAHGKDFMAFDRSIDVHIGKLRVKLEADPKSPKRIRTVWGTGYMFVESP
jgi:two-component system, OmpR family, phosphate regulon response regulator OmpR